MSAKYDDLRNVSTGRTDWRIRVRVVREWRGKTATGQPFTNYNLLLLDSKGCRMQASVPTYLAPKIQRMLQVHKMYIITNFQVKELTADDKWRAVNMDKQIQFINQTKAREIPESEHYISQNEFDFFALNELEMLLNQNINLADVVGVVIKRDDLKVVHTSSGADKPQVKMRITDGRSEINVTFWDYVAEDFQNHINNITFEEPLIIIVASGKVSKWQDQIDVCNFSPTTFYINYNHHSVADLRKSAPNFPKQKEPITFKRTLQMSTVADIHSLPSNFINENVGCQVTIDKVEEVPTWYYSVCTSCFKQVNWVEDTAFCKMCDRIVPEPDKKFGVCVLASDKTGEIGIVLMDRPIRTLFGKRVYEFEEEFGGAFPNILKQLENGKYTVKLLICKENIGNKNEYFLATDIFTGFEFTQTNDEEETIVKPTEYSIQEPSGTSYHLENMTPVKHETE